MNVERKTTFIAKEMVLFVEEVVLVHIIRFRYGADLKCGSFMEVNMRIVKKGYEKVHRTTCRFCNSDLEYTDADMFHLVEEERGGLRETREHLFRPTEEYINVCKQHYNCINCPVCHNTIKFVDFNHIFPETIRWEKVR